MTDKDRVDCYMAFFHEYLRRFDGRRTYEWKFNMGLWALMAILTGLVLRGQVDHELPPSWKPVAAVVSATVFLLHSVWLGFLHGVNDYDKEYAFRYKKAVEGLVSGRSHALATVEEPPRRFWRPLLRWAPLMQIVITAGLLVVLFWALSEM